MAVFFLLFALSPLAPPTFAAAQEAYEDQSVTTIDVVLENPQPNSSFDPQKILTRMKTKVGDPFSQLIFDSDLKNLSAIYDKVEPQLDVRSHGLVITLKIWERPRIHAIKWHGNRNIKSKKLREELGIKPNTPFDRGAFNQALAKVKEYYIKEGYFESSLEYTLSPEPKSGTVDIVVQVKEGRIGKIDSIRFKGFTRKERREIAQMVHTKEYNLFTSWVFDTGIYKEEELEHDRVQMVNFLQNRGYADAAVDISVEESPKNRRIVLVVRAVRGMRYYFGKVNFDGNTLFTDSEIEKALLAHQGKPYSPEKLRETAAAIKELYGRKGYIDASVSEDTRLHQDQPIYDVSFHVNEGTEYKVGLIHVVGNKQTETRVILRESLLVPGETFDAAKLKATQSRLENMGYFKSVNVYAVRTSDDEKLSGNMRDVYIEVEETTTGNVSLFAGFSSSDNLFGGLDLSESNFSYKGITKFYNGLDALRGGGEYAHVRLNVGAKERAYSLSWMTPYFRDTLWRVGFNSELSSSNLQTEEYKTTTYGVSPYASYPVTPFWTFGAKYRVRNTHTHFSNPGVIDIEKRLASRSGVVSASGVSMTYDSTDSPTKAHRGFRSITEAEVAGIGGSYAFLRLAYRNSFYQPTWKTATLKFRWELSFIEPFGWSPEPKDIPMSERFFLGGENSVRGYRPFDLGPQFASQEPSGGISAGLFSTELIQNVIKDLDLGFFFDAGSIELQRFSIRKPNMSYGVSAYLFLIGRMPLTVGMGFPINPDRHSQVKRFFFQMGAQY